MGAFLVRLLDHDSGAELGRFVAPNILAYEGIQYVLRQIFPPHQAAMTFQVGVCGATVGYYEGIALLPTDALVRSGPRSYPLHAFSS